MPAEPSLDFGAGADGSDNGFISDQSNCLHMAFPSDNCNQQTHFMLNLGGFVISVMNASCSPAAWVHASGPAATVILPSSEPRGGHRPLAFTASSSVKKHRLLAELSLSPSYPSKASVWSRFKPFLMCDGLARSHASWDSRLFRGQDGALDKKHGMFLIRFRTISQKGRTPFSPTR